MLAEEARRAAADGGGRALGWRERAGAALACVGLMAAAAGGLIASGRMPGRPGMDQAIFHGPTIRIFAHDWPRFDFEGYLAASTPLYHLLLAAVCRFVTDSWEGLRVAGMLMSLALVGVTAWACCDGGRARLALGVTVAVFASHYLLFPAAWLLPDNLGWLLAMAVLLPCLRREGGMRPLAWASVALVALVLTRQSHLWAAAVIWAAAWVGGEREMEAGLLVDAGRRARRTAAAVAMTLPAFAAVGAFVHLWGGLTPPLFHGVNQAAPGVAPGEHASLLREVAAHLNPATPAFVLAVFGVYGVFFLPGLAGAGVDLWRKQRGTLAAVTAGALAVSILPATTLDAASGRTRGVWSLAGKTPEIMGHTSPAIVLLAVIGALTLAMLCRRLGRRDAVILLVTVAAFTAAQATSKHLWQRYTAPLALIVLALGVCRAARPGLGELRGWIGRAMDRAQWAGVGTLAALMIVSSALLVAYDPPEPERDEAWLRAALFPNGGGPERIRVSPDQPRWPVRVVGNDGADGGRPDDEDGEGEGMDRSM